jgi:hypothetical protein
MSQVNRASAPQGILPGGCMLRPMNDIGGKELTLNGLQEFVQKNKGQLSLQPGASFMVYLPHSGGAAGFLGSRSTQIEGLNQKTPLKLEKVSGKPAPVREPGDWVKVTVDPNAKGFTKDRVSVVQRESIMCQPPTSEKLFNMTITVVP